MKNNIFGLIVLLAGILTLYHYMTAHYPNGVHPPDLILGMVTMLIVGGGILTKMIKIQNA